MIGYMDLNIFPRVYCRIGSLPLHKRDFDGNLLIVKLTKEKKIILLNNFDFAYIELLEVYASRR